MLQRRPLRSHGGPVQQEVRLQGQERRAGLQDDPGGPEDIPKGDLPGGLTREALTGMVLHQDYAPLDDSGRTLVEMDVQINNILEIDEVAGKIKIQFVLYVKW